MGHLVDLTEIEDHEPVCCQFVEFGLLMDIAMRWFGFLLLFLFLIYNLVLILDLLVYLMLEQRTLVLDSKVDTVFVFSVLLLLRKCWL